MRYIKHTHVLTDRIVLNFNSLILYGHVVPGEIHDLCAAFLMNIIKWCSLSHSQLICSFWVSLINRRCFSSPDISRMICVITRLMFSLIIMSPDTENNCGRETLMYEDMVSVCLDWHKVKELQQNMIHSTLQAAGFISFLTMFEFMTPT